MCATVHRAGSSCESFMMRVALRCLVFTAALLPCFAIAHQVVISELMYDSATRSTNEEWIEIYNTGTSVVSVANWKFTKGVSFTFPNLLVAPGGRLVIAANPTWFASAYPGVDSDFVTGGWIGSLANGGEAVRLEDAAGNKVDEVDYADQGDWARRVQVQSASHFGWDWFAPHSGTGKSAELINQNLHENSGQNWAASIIDGGTPAAANSVENVFGPPLVLDVRHLPLVPRSTNSVTITARIVDPNGDETAVTLFYRVDANPQNNPFTAVTMLDDGANGDGLAGDGVFGAILPPRPHGTIVEFYVQAASATAMTNVWPAPVDMGGGQLAQVANALYQVDDSTYDGPQPFYRIIMTAAELAELNEIISSDRQSDAQMNSTYVTIDGTASELRYLTGVRIRGAGSRGARPANLRVNIPSDRRWKGVSQINLNTQFTHAQVAGYALASRAGLPTETARAVQVRINAVNQASAGSPQYGSYAATETVSGEFVDAHYPLDNDGNAYRASSGGHSATLAYLGTNVSSYRNAGYSKQSNVAENDWSDLIALTYALSPNTSDADYVSAVRTNVNVEEWMLYFAMFTVTLSGETSLGTGFGDDYSMYRGAIDPRFQLLAHDWDTILGQGSGANFSTGTNLWRATALTAINRFLRHPQFVPAYYAQLQRVIDGPFSPAEAAPTLDDVLGGWIPDATIRAMKTFVTNRVAYIRSQIPLGITIQSSLPIVGGYPQTTGPTISLSGLSDAINTRTVLVNGSAATWSAWEARWTHNDVTVLPGVNKVWVTALDSNGVEIARESIDIWYNVPGTIVSGTISSSVTWTVGNAPYVVNSTVTIGSGATLTIDPGVSVHLASGANLVVASGGRLLAQGTPENNIRFTRIPNSGARWGGIVVNGTTGTPETRIAYAHLEFNNNAAIDVQGAEVFLDHLTFGTTDRRYLNLDGASFTVSQCEFPATTASLEPIYGTGGIRSGGHGIFTRNFFGRVTGYNDTIDFTGGNRPGPIVQFLDNVFVGSDDDLLDLDGTDAWVEGNIFLHVHRNGTPDSASAVSGGNDSGQTSEVTIVGNLFYDVDQAATAKQGNFYTFINNTVVRQSGAGFADSNVTAVLNFADEGVALAAGMFAEGNIIVDAERLTRNVTNGTALASNVTFNNNLMPFTWAGPGANNSTSNPALKYLPSLSETTNFTSWKSAQVLRDWFSPRPGSPAIGAGPNGRDIGGAVPIGASISGEPVGATPQNSATLTVGFNRNVPGWPNGSGYTHYRWRLDNGAWSAETPIATPIALTSLSPGAHRVQVSGKRDAGLYQDDAFYASNAVVTTSRTWIVTNQPGRVIVNEVLARNVNAFDHEETRPDIIELFNPGDTPVNLAGKGLTDDPAVRYKFVFPSNTVLAARQYLIVFADNEKDTSGLHTGFGLNANGDAVYLYDSVANGGALLDSIAFGLQLDDLSIGRVNGAWALTYPTPGAANAAHPLGDITSLKINEWLTDANASQDFVEVFNRDFLPVHIGGAWFSDTPSGTALIHQVPALSFIPANGFFPFIADGDAEQGAEHLSFKLSPDQGSIALFDAQGVLVDCVIYGPQTTDISEGRTPDGTDARGFFAVPTPGAPNPLNLNVTNIVTTGTNVLAFNRQWRFNQTDNLDGTGWFLPGYDDSSWSTGQGVLANEDCNCLPEPIRTGLTLGRITYYFRTTFVLNTNPAGANMSLTTLIDDGAVIYLNGQLLQRVRVSAANPVYSTLADSPSVNNANYETFILPGTNLVEGTNFVAVEVHQQSSGSSDVTWGMALDVTRSTTNVIQFNLVLNEVMANNRSYTNADGTITDWVEIHNPGVTPADLSDMSLSDDVAQPRRWVFPAGTVLPPGGYLTVNFDPDSPATTNAGPNLNTGFGFSSGGDAALLFDKLSRGGALLESVQFGLQAADFSIGRVPNASGAWTLTLPTEGSANIAAALGDPNALRVNEWMADPRPGDDDYFEIYNPNAQPVALGGLYLTDNLNNRTQFRIPNLSFIGVGIHAFVEFVADNNPQNGADHVNFRLAGSGESVAIYAADGLTRIDSITFGAQQSGVSEGRFPDGAATIVRFPRTPTPGQANFLPFNDVVISEALTHTDPPLEDAIELFNTTATPIDIGGWYLSDSQLEPQKFRIPDGTIIQPGGFVVFYENQFNPTFLFPSFSLSSVDGDEIFLSLTDAQGNLTGYRASVDFGPQVNGVTFGRFETSIGFDFPALSERTLGVDNPATVEQFRTGRGKTNSYAKVGPVVIGEIMYHPPDLGTNDNSRDEFIELYNFGAVAVPLFDTNFPANTWHLRDAVDFDFPSNTWIGASSRLVVVGFDPATNATDLAAFRARYGIGAEVVILGPWDGRLANDDDEVRLNMPDAPNLGDVPYVLVERVHYRDNLPWPSAADGNTNGAGISLHRVVAQNYGNDPVNWVAAAPTPGSGAGATPLTPPSITTQPANRTVVPGTSVSFVVAAAGSPTLRYQWRYNGFDIPNATNASYTVTSAQFTNAGAYSVRVMNSVGAALSANALLTIQSAPQIIYQPRDVNTAPGGTVAFTVGARGTPALGFQWWKDNAPLGGATEASLIISNVQSPHLGNYFVVVSNAFGVVTSAVATLQISAPPVIVVHPTNQTAVVGQTVTFSVGVSGSAPFFYRWYFNGVPLAGATSSNLVFTNVQPSRAGTYSVLVSNSVGTAFSSNATLTVIVPPTVTIAATDPSASETGPDAGVFTITRASGTNVALTVNYSITGTAANGPDYQTIPSSATIPVGSNSVRVVINPINDPDLEASETVTLTLVSSLNYLIGSPSNATVTIADDDNLPPAVSINTPTNGTFLPWVPTNVFVAATASDPNAGQSVRVDFYFGTNLIGTVLNAPYQFTWSNAPSGSNLLVAVATDALGLSTASAPIALSINAPPLVSITSPTNTAMVPGSGNVIVTASATDTNGGVAQVDFYLDGTRFATATNSPYSGVITNPAFGPYQTFAVARDTYGLSATSAVVNFTVVPPGTNFADMFASRGFITGVTNFKTGNNTTATKEAGEPNHFPANAGGKSVWLSWTAPGNGVVTIDLLGSGFDTVLGVYSNAPGVPATVSNLISVAYGDDNGASLQSKVTFTNRAGAGTVFHIAVDGYNSGTAASGSIVMRLSLLGPPVITTQPRSQTNDVGSNVTFSVAASSIGPQTYQWRFNGANLPGANSAGIAVNNIQTTNAGNYDVIVSNNYGSITSAVATLTVRTGPVEPLAIFARMTNSFFTMTFSGGGAGRTYLLESSTSLTNWTLFRTFTNTGGVTIVDSNPPPSGLRAFRVRLAP